MLYSLPVHHLYTIYLVQIIVSNVNIAFKTIYRLYNAVKRIDHLWLCLIYSFYVRHSDTDCEAVEMRATSQYERDSYQDSNKMH